MSINNTEVILNSILTYNTPNQLKAKIYPYRADKNIATLIKNIEDLQSVNGIKAKDLAIELSKNVEYNEHTKIFLLHAANMK